MQDSEVESILWHPHDQSIEVIYASRGPDRLIASHEIAAAFAEDVGLGHRLATDGSVRWQRAGPQSESA